MDKHIYKQPVHGLFYFLDNFSHGCEIHTVEIFCMDGLCSGVVKYSPEKGIVEEDANT